MFFMLNMINIHMHQMLRVCVDNVSMLVGFTLIGLHVHVWPWPVVPHGLALRHVHLGLCWHALGGRDRVIVAAHCAVATGGHTHRATGHVGGLVWTWTGTL